MFALIGKRHELIVQLFYLICLTCIKSTLAELTPPYFNLATGRKIYSTATCGVDSDGPELYCKLVGANTEHDNQYFSVIQGQVCDFCDPNRSDKRHPPEYAIDGKETWWQSPPLSRGMKYNEVNLTIDFGQEFHVAYVYIRMGNSPRPGLWTLEKSSDYGKTWVAWQHFSDTSADCETYFTKKSLKPIRNDNDVICTTEYSKIVPLENGEIPVMLLENRPSANNYFNSTVLQEWTRATNVRIRLRRTKNLLGHLMSVVSKDPSVTRRYFYSIKDISIGGRCMCNGHADTCDVLDPKSTRRLLACRCQHKTCGIQCNECCPGFEQKKWRQNTNARPFQCEPCNCFGHSSHCEYNEDIDIKRLSLDIHGRYDGGGVCHDCNHNTEGINCNKCKSKFYRPFGKQWNETDVCATCNCNYFYSTGNCEEGSGRCECRKEFQPPNCDSCAHGYFGYPDCRECECNLNGTASYHCASTDGKCPCKLNYSGQFCKQCAEGFYDYPICNACQCNDTGSASSNCDHILGNCTCLGNFGGNKCDRCKHGYYLYPNCSYCDCDVKGTHPDVCEKDTGKCLCREGFGGPRCDQCIPGYFNYPNCVPCNCSSFGSELTTCDAAGKCLCLTNFAGKQCRSCSAGHYSFPDCLSCDCDSRGSQGISCNADGQCSCLFNFNGKKCDICLEGFYNFPSCEECNCDPAGVTAKFTGCGSMPSGELCQCKERVAGRICDQCKSLYWNLNMSNSDGCEDCDCFLDGTIGSLDTCNSKTGQCSCKPFVQSRQCKECSDGTFDLFGENLFGCKDCSCDIGGSRNTFCNKVTGECSCHPRIAGRRCTHPLTTHFFPTLFQFQFEYEDGYAISGAYVRYQFDENVFPGFSRKGYAVFSSLQSEILNEVNIFKSSVYRMVIRYVNPSNDDILATILITSDNPNELDQSASVLLKPTKHPEFLTISGKTGDTPAAVVLDPGRYTISTRINKHILLDFFVLLPAAYYEASILSQHIKNPCELGNMQLCRHYVYPSVAEFNQAYIGLNNINELLIPAKEEYEDQEHLSAVGINGTMSIISNTQKTIVYNLSINKTGKYIIVVDYVTDRKNSEMYILQVKAETGPYHGYITMYPCTYTMVCRQPVTDSESRERNFFLDKDVHSIYLYHDHNDFGKVVVSSVTAIPTEEWSIDFVQPKPVCVMKNGKCLKSFYRSVPDSKKIEFRSLNEEKISTNLPNQSHDGSEKLIYLNVESPTIEVNGKVLREGRFVILLKYYQPYHSQFIILYRLETNEQDLYGTFEVQHCPSIIGCRALILQANCNWFDIKHEFKLHFTNTNIKGLWVDYLLIVPLEEYNEYLLEEEKFDRTQEFIQKCGQNHFHIQLNASDFCRKSVFSLTADYNNGALPCNCDYDGSTSFECDPFGGQCPCKPNVIGRQCDSCRTAFWGFPDCKHCDCPLTALCHKDTGECICPTHVIGEKCDVCEPFTYGFHQIIGCEECNCNDLGVENNNLQCDIHNGSCACRTHIEGRACDKCSNGFHHFPHCQPCRCNIPGTTFDVCDKIDESCYCKKNVVGSHCEHCGEGTFNLQVSNPEGCTKCFCFGKTNRCESAYLRIFNVSIMQNISILTIYISNDAVNFQLWNVSQDEIMINETTLEVDFSSRKNEKELVYVRMLNYLGNQHNHLTSYGGVLAYTLYYTTGLFGSALHGPDVILQSEDNIMLHRSHGQPASSHLFTGQVNMIETSFQNIDGTPVSREEFMMTLRSLHGVYIRVSYWDQSVITQISDVFLTIADEDENRDFYESLPIEKCFCPQGYDGLSCENCAPGYYRDPDGPFGGYCIPCQCNGHANSCDCNTGICENCQHFTTGKHCEECLLGYHGNATAGTPNDCMICACPLPYESNNFGFNCEISDSGIEIHCTCMTGYTGPRCESCASGYYGQPEVLGASCKRCECSGNINVSEPNACDTVSGECLKCLNNTYGKACNLCAPGFFGDAVNLKDCKSCDCEMLGTEYCDSVVGSCNCNVNVIGKKCERCQNDHYGYDSGMGCKPCDCALASTKAQCDEHSGQCDCMAGVAGRQCDRCATGFWNYTGNGCASCSCNQGYSRGFGCNVLNGQCECLPGVIGSKCDACPYRWVLIQNEGCFECNNCIYALLDTTEKLKHNLEPVHMDFKGIALSYFTAQRLSYFSDVIEKVVPAVKALDPRGVNLSPYRHETESLVMDVKSLRQQIGITSANTKECVDGGQSLLKTTYGLLKETGSIKNNTLTTISEVEFFENSFEITAIIKVDNALTEVKLIFEELATKIKNVQNDNLQQLASSEYFLESTQDAVQAVYRQKFDVTKLRNNVAKLTEKLYHIKDWTVAANGRSNDILQVNDKNQEAFDYSQFRIVISQTNEVKKNLIDSSKLMLNGDLNLHAIDNNLDVIVDALSEFKENNKKVDELLPKIEEDYRYIQTIVDVGKKRLTAIMSLALNITEQYSNITSTSEEAIKASRAYSDIVCAVLDANHALIHTKHAAINTTELSDGINERSKHTDETVKDFLQKSRSSFEMVEMNLLPHLNLSSTIVSGIIESNRLSDAMLADINFALEELPRELNNTMWNTSQTRAFLAKKTSKYAKSILDPILKQVLENLDLAKKLPKFLDSSGKDIGQTTQQVDKVEELVPKLSTLVSSIDIKQTETSSLGSDLGDRIDTLKKKIDLARDVANGIGLGVTFQPNTVLELKPPENLSHIASPSKVTAYFNTSKPNGFLFYIGNDNKILSRTRKEQNFMALEIENGYPVLTIDLGNGPEKIINHKYVSDGSWYQVIIDRIGNLVNVTIREEKSDGSIQSYQSEQRLPENLHAFNVDGSSKIYVGGYSADFAAPEEIRYSSFEGQIEDFQIDNEHIGLWNFIDGGESLLGAIKRNKMVSQEQASTGYRFNGNGYLVMDTKPYHFKYRSSIHFRFKASKNINEGLLFFAGQGEYYILVELKDATVSFEYKLGAHKVVIGTNTTFNDDHWHSVEAERDGSRGVLKVDGKYIYQEESLPGMKENLEISDKMYFGGLPRINFHVKNVSKDFEGCINDVAISGTPIDLSRNIEAYGVRSGCPANFYNTLSYTSNMNAFLRHSNVSSNQRFNLRLNFKTRKNNGIIFFASDKAQKNYIGLVIMNGELVLRSMNTDVSTSGIKYNDGETHLVVVSQLNQNLSLQVDDTYHRFEIETIPLVFAPGDIYFGGIAPYAFNDNTLPTRAQFIGCISDVTINDRIVNFAEAAEKSANVLFGCPADISDISIVDGNSVDYPNETTVHNASGFNLDSSDSNVSSIDETLTSTFKNIMNDSDWVERILPKTTILPILEQSTTKRIEHGTNVGSTCKLSANSNFEDINASQSGYRFGTIVNSRIEAKQIPSKIKKNYVISLEFKTDAYDGILFYAADTNHVDFIALYLKRGKVHYTFRIGLNVANISSSFYYNDEKWHKVTITRQHVNGEMIIDKDDINQGSLQSASRTVMSVQAPYFIGDVSTTLSDDLNLNLHLEQGSQYRGCIRAISIQNIIVPVTSLNLVGVIPCSEDIEKGVYFNKGFVKLRDRFNVGKEFAISFDIKPRTMTGMLLSVHGRNAYLILQMLNGTIYFSVDNGEGPIIATFDPSPGENLCDGNWKTVEAIKSRYVITLIVNSITSQPAIGSATHLSTETTRPLFLGGHPHLLKVRGLTARKPFIGCIRNLKLKDIPEVIHPSMTYGEVRTGVCPIN